MLNYIGSNFIDINSELKDFTESDADVKTILKWDIKLYSEFSEVFELRKEIANILGLKMSTLRLLDIEEGAIMTFLVPANVADIIFTGEKKFTAEEVKVFQRLLVLSLKCGDSKFNFEEKVACTTANRDEKTGAKTLLSISGNY